MGEVLHIHNKYKVKIQNRIANVHEIMYCFIHKNIEG